MDTLYVFVDNSSTIEYIEMYRDGLATLGFIAIFAYGIVWLRLHNWKGRK